jgi:hypothetical protein
MACLVESDADCSGSARASNLKRSRELTAQVKAFAMVMATLAARGLRQGSPCHQYQLVDAHSDLLDHGGMHPLAERHELGTTLGFVARDANRIADLGSDHQLLGAAG